jgi:hypothetical protein
VDPAGGWQYTSNKTLTVIVKDVGFESDLSGVRCVANWLGVTLCYREKRKRLEASVCAA